MGGNVPSSDKRVLKSAYVSAKSDQCLRCPLEETLHPWPSTLRKYAYSNILKILPPKNENFKIKKNLICFIFLLKL